MDSKVPVGEVLAHDSLSAFMADQVQSVLSDVLRGSYYDLYQEISKRLGIRLDMSPYYIQRVLEAVQRRHLILHNGGIIN
jgi:hypothetical protein